MKTLIARMAGNTVASNLLMLLIFFSGILSLWNIDREVYPRLNLRRIMVETIYPGAGPPEVEQAVCIPIENALHDLEGVKRLDTEIEGDQCKIKVSVRPGYTFEGVMNSVRSRAQTVPRLPKAIERVDVYEDLGSNEDGVIWVALYGPSDAASLKRYGERIHADLTRLAGVENVYDYGLLHEELAIQVSADKLRQLGLSLADVAEAVRNSSIDVPGGWVKSPAGDLSLRVAAQARDAKTLTQHVLSTRPDGSRILLGDVATVTDGLQERAFVWHHDGQPGIGWEVHAKSNTVAAARAVKRYVDDNAKLMPEGIKLVTWWDDSQAFDERVYTLLEDGIAGFLLVFAVLALFLRTRVALWASIGILTSIFGALAGMALLNVPLNMFSLFGFLLAMGILVDDAIIVGDAIHARQLAGEAGVRGVIAGVSEVARPVILAVAIAGVAFLPGLFLPGWAGQMMWPICMVMILTLVFSLVEALLILPAHLVGTETSSASSFAPSPLQGEACPEPVLSEVEGPSRRGWDGGRTPISPVANLSLNPNPLPVRGRGLERIRTGLNRRLEQFVARIYQPFLQRIVNWRYLTAAIFTALLLCTAALVAGGYIRLSLSPDVTKDTAWLEFKTPAGTPFSETRALATRVERAFFSAREAVNRQQTQGAKSAISQLESLIQENWAGFWLEVAPHARQWLDVEQFMRDWRSRLGDIGPAKIDLHYREGDVSYDLEFELRAPNPEVLPKAAALLKQKLANYPGVFDVIDSAAPGKPEIRLKLTPDAERLGLRLADLAGQVRGGFYGEEAQRFMRGPEEVRVMVRFPLNERQSLDQLRAMPIRLPDGGITPLSSLAEISFAPGAAFIKRQDRQRILSVSARVENLRIDPGDIYADLEQHHLPALERELPGLRIGLSQDRLDQQASMRALWRNALLALVVIYALIAIPFKSYSQPFIFLLSVPVAWMGAVLSHKLAGLPLSMESLVGMVAASGVVVNDSLVLLDYLHERRASGLSPAALIAQACSARFRPILLAFLTNFAGFAPTLLERSMQAQFLVPMTLSLAAGLLFGMIATLVLTPACYAILEDFRGQQWRTDYNRHAAHLPIPPTLNPDR